MDGENTLQNLVFRENEGNEDTIGNIKKSNVYQVYKNFTLDSNIGTKGGSGILIEESKNLEFNDFKIMNNKAKKDACNKK